MTSKFCRALTAKQMAELLHQLPSHEPWHEVFFFPTMFHCLENHETHYTNLAKGGQCLNHWYCVQQAEDISGQYVFIYYLYTVNLFVFLYFNKLLVFFWRPGSQRCASRFGTW